MLATLSIFGEFERLLGDLYPYRYVITPLLAAGAAFAAFLLVRRGAHLYLWRHRIVSVLVGTPLLIAGVVAGDYLLSPLWERSFLEEPSPVAASAPASGAGLDAPAQQASGDSSAQAPSVDAPAVEQAGVTLRGEFAGADDFHFGRGDALIIPTESGHVLRFENFSVRNGPDLYVYLSSDPTGQTIDESLNLGDLKATDGAFNYEVPADVDIDQIKSVVVWCRQFSVLFTHATLM